MENQSSPSQESGSGVLSSQSAASLQARRFGWKALLFALPLLAVIGLLEGVLWGAGETLPIAVVVERQQQDKQLLWLRGRMDQGSAPYKWAGYRRHQPRIIAVGSSRVMKFRSEMFGRDAAAFYNLGLLVTNVDDLNLFVDAIDTDALDNGAHNNAAGAPRVAMVGVDSWWLNGNFHKERNLPLKPIPDAAFDWRAHGMAWRDLLRINELTPALDTQRQTNSKFAGATVGYLWKAWRNPQTPSAAGVQARLLGKGFRADGSFRVGNEFPIRPSQWRASEDRYPQLIPRGEEEMVFTDGVSRARLEQLKRALAVLQRKGFFVMVFNPPLISSDAHLMKKTPQQRRFWHEYQTLVPRLCREMAIPFCDASTPQKLGLADYHMSDPVHAEETFHLYVLRAWLKDARARKALPDASRVVEAAIKSKRTGIWIPDLSAANAPPRTPLVQPGGHSKARPPKT